MITYNYIKMCEKAEEIQKYILRRSGEYQDESKWITTDKSKTFVKYHFWLPTLEQLFEMIGNYKQQVKQGLLSILVMKKYKYESLNELVLCCVMETKYHKFWNGEEWEGINVL